MGNGKLDWWELGGFFVMLWAIITGAWILINN